MTSLEEAAMTVGSLMTDTGFYLFRRLITYHSKRETVAFNSVTVID